MLGIVTLAAGMDWITATRAQTDLDNPLWQFASHVQRDLTDAGCVFRAWAWSGYVGYSSDHMAAGVRQDGTYLRLSSDVAAIYWQRAVTASQNVSRVDLQVTVELERPRINLAAVEYALAVERASALDARRKIALIKAHPAGQTLYIGSRQSDTFLRLYDKGAENGSDTSGKTWRYEVEYKNDRAREVSNMLNRHSSPHDGITALVHAEFTKRGTTPLFDRKIPAPTLSLSRIDPTTERQLIWLNTQVRPVIEKLLAAGERDRTIAALGLTGFLDQVTTETSG